MTIFWLITKLTFLFVFFWRFLFLLNWIHSRFKFSFFVKLMTNSCFFFDYIIFIECILKNVKLLIKTNSISNVLSFNKKNVIYFEKKNIDFYINNTINMIFIIIQNQKTSMFFKLNKYLIKIFMNKTLNQCWLVKKLINECKYNRDK